MNIKPHVLDELTNALHKINNHEKQEPKCTRTPKRDVERDRNLMHGCAQSRQPTKSDHCLLSSLQIELFISSKCDNFTHSIRQPPDAALVALSLNAQMILHNRPKYGETQTNTQLQSQTTRCPTTRPSPQTRKKVMFNLYR